MKNIRKQQKHGEENYSEIFSTDVLICYKLHCIYNEKLANELNTIN